MVGVRLGEPLGAFEQMSEPGPAPLHYIVAVAIGGALAWRRTYPLIVAPFVQVLLGLQALFVGSPNVYVSIVVWVIAVFSLAAYAPSWRSIAVPAMVVAGFGILQGSLDPDDPVGSAATVVIFEAIVLTARGEENMVARRPSRRLASEP